MQPATCSSPPGINVFRCPHCGNALEQKDSSFSCRTCDRLYPISHSVPDFTRETDYYYGEFPQETMRTLINEAERIGAVPAIHNVLRDKTPEWREYFEHYSLGEARAAWQFILELPEHASVLDFGCGWGNLAISLARNFETVFAMDIVPERAAIAGIRARELGFGNVIAIAGGNTPHLPFPDDQLDAVVLNGVLEWVPCSFPHIADPRQAQLAVLREIRRVLKPAGQLYIGIENRTGYRYFLGRPDEHSTLKYTTLMPRALANRYSLAKRREPYRTYTYNWRGYRKLLREAGFADAQFYSPYPDYRDFRYIIKLDRPKHLAHALQPTSLAGRVGLQICKRVNVFREVSPAYSITAPRRETFAERLLRRIGATGDFHIYVTNTATALLFADDVVVRLPLTQRAETRMNVEAANLQHAFRSHVAGIPEPLVAGKFQSQSFFARRTVPGVSGNRYLANPEFALRQAVDFLTEFHVATRNGQHVMSHGDFSLQNIIFDEETRRLTGVIDWDLAKPAGWPLIDLLNLFVAVEYETRPMTTNAALLIVLEKFCRGGFERSLLDAYLAKVPVERAGDAVSTYLHENISNKREFGDAKVEPMLATLEQDLEKAQVLAGKLF
jgi:ubiquinone/menaquinone biosynthesis C-methylase UbiE